MTEYNFSTDYAELFEYLCAGAVIAAFVDYTQGHKEFSTYKDVCQVRREGPYEIFIGARGTGYGGIYPFMQDDGEEIELLKKQCEALNLRWIKPAPASEALPQQRKAVSGQGAEPAKSESVNLTARQLREALSYANPDSPDAEEEETEIVIQWLPQRVSVEGEPMPAGYYLWYVDCPEEGVIGPLGT